MEILLLIETKDFNKVRDILLKDDVVSRASLAFKEAKGFNGKEGYYCRVSGSEEQCRKALELTKDLAKEVKNKEGEEVLNKMKDEEEESMKGFGGIFG